MLTITRNKINSLRKLKDFLEVAQNFQQQQQHRVVQVAAAVLSQGFHPTMCKNYTPDSQATTHIITIVPARVIIIYHPHTQKRHQMGFTKVL